MNANPVEKLSCALEVKRVLDTYMRNIKVYSFNIILFPLYMDIPEMLLIGIRAHLLLRR